MWVLAPLEEQSLFLLTEQSLQTPKHLGVTFMKLTLYVLNFLQYVYMSIHVHTGAKTYMWKSEDSLLESVSPTMWVLGIRLGIGVVTSERLRGSFTSVGFLTSTACGL